MKKTGLVVWVICLIGVIAGWSTLIRPAVQPASAPADVFSAERAMEHVDAIAQAPHPAGSEEIDRVRTNIFDELQALGLNPEIQTAQVLVPTGSTFSASAIENIFAVIPGSGTGSAIVLDAHFDTRMMTPGASDCSSCVGIVLETARALLAGSPLKNDVILLFTDNEEYGGGLGAIAFLENTEEEIGLALAFEGLGRTGPSIMFESAPGSGWLVREWGKAAALPLAQSWFQEIYSRTPINSDLDAFSASGAPGLSFGFWAGGTVYHGQGDTYDNLDPRSIQHQGAQALALTRRLGDIDLAAAAEKSGDAVFFTVLPGVMVSYPSSWALPLALFAGMLIVAVLILGRRRGEATVSGALRGAGLHLLFLVLSAGVTTGIWMGISQLHGEYQAQFTFRGLTYNAHFYVLAFAFLTLAISVALVIWARKKSSILDLTLGTTLFWWLLALVTSIVFPGLSYLFTWPVIAMSLAMGWVALKGKNDVALTLGALLGIILIIPVIYVAYQFVLAPMIGVLVFFLALLLGLLGPQIELLGGRKPLAVILGLVGVSVVLLVVGSLTAGFTPDHPRPNAVAYLLEADSGEATWIQAGTVTDAWTEQFFSDEPAFARLGSLFPMERPSRFPVLQGSAASVALPAPDLQILEDTTDGDIRTLHLRLVSARSAPVIELDIAPYQAVIAVTLDGKRCATSESNRDLWTLIYYAVPAEGIDLVLEVDAHEPLSVQMIDSTWDLLLEVIEDSGVAYTERTSAMMRMPNFDYGTVVVSALDIR